MIKTVGTESNVKEIYDACNELAKDPGNFILNQFSEFGNHLGHFNVTGRALGHVFEQVRADSGRDLRLAAFTSATGSAGTIAAGDRLKEEYGTKIVAVEALECPTMLENGFGEHNIQGIGDKHIPLIHNVTNTDVVVAISDKATDELDLMFNSEAGRAHLARKGVPEASSRSSSTSGSRRSATCLAAIKTAKLLDLGPDDALVTIATDGAALYPSERAKLLATRFGGEFTSADAAEAFGEHLANVDTDHMIDCTEADRRRIFNLGYYTWVEQQGTPFELFEARRHQDFWKGLRRYVDVWDEMIDDFNAARVGGQLTSPCTQWSAGRARCAARRRDLLDPAPWRCPNSTLDDRHHLLTMVQPSTGGAASAWDGSGHPFVENDRRLAWASIAAAHGMRDAARTALVHELDHAVAAVDGVGFHTTPFARSAGLSDELGFSPDGGVWVKDETGGVGGSQKARHLFSILLHLRAMELLGHLPIRPRLAIASCGNAALAAATLARAAAWPIDVYVPTWMGDGFGDRLDELGATVHRCERRNDDPPGDPAMLRFRAAVAQGAVPFTVQGPENALCLDGGRTIGWEMAAQIDAGPRGLDAVFVQVGGGAFATCLGAGLVESGHHPKVMAVQAVGCAPLDRAWQLGATSHATTGRP